ncbi:hypothetical protein SAMN04487980_101762 [Streptomyces sp. cf124]|uniref:hypothetical protein n=1 Tax=unclassified Streptomyces TaxID=2593676 RepID=UPI0008E6945B|nr:hypothetical protein SAMN04487980_101762 [Streptomyces sp. cf124]
MDRAREHTAHTEPREQPAPRDSGPPPDSGRSTTDAPALELLVHGVGGTTPERMLDDPRTVRVTGDDTAAVFRRIDDADAETRPADYRGKPVPEAYVWCNLTSGNSSRALWLLLLPFMVVNLAHWMRPTARGRRGTVRLYGLLVRLAGLTLTVLLVAAACEVALDLTAWQCAGARACAQAHTWLGFLSPAVSDGGWWSQPGRRLAVAAVVPTALTGLLWYLSHRTWSEYESQRPMDRDDGRPDDAKATPEAPGVPDAPGASGSGAAPRLAPDVEDTARVALGRPGFWYGRRLVARLRAAHAAAGFLTVAAAVGTSAARHDRRAGGPALLELLGWLLNSALVLLAVAVVWVVCRRGRSERRLDKGLDENLVRRLPACAVAVLVLAVVYAGWSRPGWRSTGRLPGDLTFGGITLVQGLLVVALGVVAHTLHRSRPDARTAMYGLAGPAVAMLACALGGVMSAGVAQRVADWLGGTDDALAGPPVLLTWQASVIPPLLLVLLGLLGWLTRRTLVLRRAETEAVEREYGLTGEEPHQHGEGLPSRQGLPGSEGLAGREGLPGREGLAGREGKSHATRPSGPEWAPGSGASSGSGGPSEPVTSPGPGRASDSVAGPGPCEAAVPGDSGVPGDEEREARDSGRTRRIARTRAMAALTDRAPRIVAVISTVTLLLGAAALTGALVTGETPARAAQGSYDFVEGAAQTAQALGSWLIGVGFLLFVTWGRRAYKDASARRTIGILWDVGTFWPRAAHPFAPPCYAERAVPDLTWRMATWTRTTGGRLVLSGHSQGSVLAAAAAWQLTPSVRSRVALLTYGSPLERLYGRWFPAHFGPEPLAALHREVDCWRNLYRRTDPIGGPVRLTSRHGPQVDAEPFSDPLAYGRTGAHPLPAPILGHSDYQADPAFVAERRHLLDRLGTELPGPRASP